jgi:uncharacterized protein (TIRG00374 family)
LRKEILKRLSTILRIIVGVGLIVFLLWRLDISKVIDNLRGLDLRYLGYAFIPYIFFIIFSAWRWQVLLDHKGFGMGFGRTLAVYFIAIFFNNFLPTTVGGDVMRVIYSAGTRRTDALATVLADRILGFVGLFIFALIAVLYLLIRERQTEFLPLMLVGLIILILLTYVLFSERAYSWISPATRRLRIFRLGERINRLHETATDFGGAWGPITLCVIHSIVIQIMLALGPFLVLRGLGNHQVGVLPFFIYLPIINVVSMLPISLNGIGIRENFFVILFSRVGLSGETALSVSLLSFILIFVLSIIGGIIFILYKKGDRSVVHKEVR